MKNFFTQQVSTNIAILVLLLLFLPGTLSLLSQSQHWKTQALGSGTAVLSFSPAVSSVKTNVSSTLNVFVAPNGEQVNGVEINMTYDPNIITVTDIKPGTFFTSVASTVGQPVEIQKQLGTGTVHYALAFPLGSNYSSTTAADAAIISYTAKANGTSPLTFVDGPQLVVSNLSGTNVLGSVINGSVVVTDGARLYFSAPRPANPETRGTTFDIDVMLDTNGQAVDAVDAKINFDLTKMTVNKLTQGNIAGFTSYPALTFTNTSSGTITISANDGSGSTATPPNGNGLVVGTITMNANTATTSTSLIYNYVQGSRNDSNVVLAGTAQTSDPVDILTSVTNADITINTSSTNPTPTATPIPTATPTPLPTATPKPTNTPTPAPTMTPSPTPTPRPTNTPAPTPASTPTPTPAGSLVSYNCGCDSSCNVNANGCGVGTPICIATNGSCSSSPSCGCYSTTPVTPTPTPIAGPRTFQAQFLFQGITRIGVDNTENLTISYKNAAGTVTGSTTVTTSSTGIAQISLNPDDYSILVKAPGYLARKFNLSVTSNTASIDLRSTPIIGGDFNGDGVVNEIDYANYLANYGTANQPSDIDKSGQVNSLDFGILRSNFGLTSDSL